MQEIQELLAITKGLRDNSMKLKDLVLAKISGLRNKKDLKLYNYKKYVTNFTFNGFSFK